MKTLSDEPGPKTGARGWISRVAGRAVFWARTNLFGSWFDSLLTMATLWVAASIVSRGLLPMAALDWSVIRDNLKLILTGSYPEPQLWRVWIAVLYVSLFGGFSFGGAGGRMPRSLAIVAAAQCFLFLAPISTSSKAYVACGIALQLAGFFSSRLLDARARAWIAGAAWISFLPLSFFLAYGMTGPDGWMPVVATNYWGGLLLTLMISLTSIALSFPLGLLLALGRRSSLVLVRAASTCFIEVVRGVPLITILFIAYLIIPLALPASLNPSVFIRAMIGVIAFHSAYMAENFRGGLQGIPRTQYEAAASLNLSKGKTMVFVILPQVMKRMIPVLVSSFTGTLKDTSLISIIGLLDMIGISSAIVSNPEYMTSSTQVLVFMAAIYFVLCYSISSASYRLEARLGVTTTKAGGL
ncbi:MAG: amino acid ABC transporter permease [Spirochaetes bacterium]|nr:amino acid ABC transporter permease [Spirochaetota bacterium]MBU1080158.1 amino acid ABC transporter permease [Spirochaetota bacterium]